MQDKNDLQEFELDDLISEFQDPSEVSDDAGELTGELADLLGDWGTEETAVPMDTIRMNDLISQLTSGEAPASETGLEAETAPAKESAASAPMDTLRMNNLISQIIEETQTPKDLPEGATIRLDAIPDKVPVDTADDDMTIRLDSVPEGETIRLDPVSDSPTIRMEPLVAETSEAEEEAPESKIIYNPRTRLRELKKKLIAGPEKRYYELSELGIGKIQIALIANLAVCALCILTTVLFSLDMMPDSRLRFVIFSQILAMLLSAFFGCSQMIDGIADIFKGRFGVNSMLLFTFLACCVDAVFCLSELRIPCCAAFSLQMTMALWSSYQKHSTEMAQMDSLRKAVRLQALVKAPDYFNKKPGILRREGDLEDFMDHYTKRSGPELVQSIYCILSLLLCTGIAVFAAMTHGTSMGIQILSTSLLVAVPAGFFICLSRPAALLERRLHMVGTVLCGWRGVKGLCGKAAFPLRDEDLFPSNTTKMNGVKFYGDRNPDETVSYAASLICAAGGGLVPLFRQMQESRSCATHRVENFRDYGSGGIGGEICGEPVLVGSLDFLQDMNIHIPEGTMVSQAVYAAIDGQLCAVFAISYAKMRSAAAGIVSLCGNRKITPVLTGIDFMLTDTLLRTKFGVNTRRIAFPDQEIRSDLSVHSTDFEAPVLALATRDDLASYAYAVSGASALRTSCRLGTSINLISGILGMLIMAALAYLGTTDLLTPVHILLYQLVWLIPGLLITEWTRTV
ncbi:MAG: hypothetical protein IKY96_09345 [Oscillospiraceae bacterium]|nr:hypothetical protein [Oscillospiraceae bacterium]